MQRLRPGENRPVKQARHLRGSVSSPGHEDKGPWASTHCPRSFSLWPRPYSITFTPWTLPTSPCGHWITPQGSTHMAFVVGHLPASCGRSALLDHSSGLLGVSFWTFPDACRCGLFREPLPITGLLPTLIHLVCLKVLPALSRNGPSAEAGGSACVQRLRKAEDMSAGGHGHHPGVEVWRWC